MFKKIVLKNKTNLFLIPLKDTKSATVLVMYPVGSRYESAKLAGVSHFIEHLMFKGTKKRPNTLALTREIDRLGAEYNAFTSKEYTGYYIKTDSEYLNVSLDILSDMLFNSKFEEKEMEKEKKVIVEELRMYNDNPIMHIETLFEDLMYKGDLGRDVGGSEKTVLGLARKDALNYLSQHYQTQRAIIAVAGNINENTKKLVEKYFVKSGKNTKSENYAPAEFGSTKTNDRLRIENKKTDQTQLMLGLPGFHHNDPVNPVLTVFNTVFGGSMSSRLFIQIREKRGLAYMIRSGAESYRDTGYFFVRAGLEAKNINKAISVIKDEAEKIIKKGVTTKELADAKTHLRGSLVLSMEDSSAQTSWYARQAMFYKVVKTPEERLKEIDKVTNEDIKKLAKKLFNWSKLRVAIIGDVKKEEIKF